MSTNWDRHDFYGKINAILSSVAPTKPGHHLGAPFFTAYQIAIEFNRRHGAIVKQLGLKVGGKRIGERKSLAQYIARQLSQRIKSGQIVGLEGGFLSGCVVQNIAFEDGVESSAERGKDISLYRLK